MIKAAYKARISVEDLFRLESLREQKKALQNRLEATDVDLKYLELSLIQALEAGSTNPQGFSLEVKETLRRYPRWRDLWVQEFGLASAEKALDETEPTITQNLVIKKIA